MMTARVLAIAAILSLALSSLPASRADDISNPAKMPLFDNFTTPVLAPGESGDINFTIKDRYADKIINLTLGVEVYKYATLSESRDVDARFADPPRISYMGRDYGSKLDPPILVGSLPPGQRVEVRFTVHTSQSTPHGDLFNSASYNVRFRIDFEYMQAGVTGKHKMLSRGYISDPDWENATRGGGLNITYLKTRYGMDALITETSFTVREPMPLWPLFLLVGLAVLFGVLGAVFYLHETHGYFPTLDQRLKEWSGKLRKTRGPPKKRKDEP